jgi:HSP20 family protein
VQAATTRTTPRTAKRYAAAVGHQYSLAVRPAITDPGSFKTSDAEYSFGDYYTMTRTPDFDSVEIDTLFDRMSQQFEEMTRQFDGTRTFRRNTAVDLRDDPEAFEVVIDLPGFEKADIDVTIADRELTVDAARDTGTVSPKRGDDDVRYVRQERRTDSVHRSIRLPGEVRSDDASATYNNGVLTVTLPKRTVDDEDSHRIDVE